MDFGLLARCDQVFFLDLRGLAQFEGVQATSDRCPWVFRVSGLISKGLILAQNERWRRGLGMQVGRAARPVGARVSKATVTNPMVGHSREKSRVIPSDVAGGHSPATKGAIPPWDGPSWY